MRQELDRDEMSNIDKPLSKLTKRKRDRLIKLEMKGKRHR